MYHFTKSYLALIAGFLIIMLPVKAADIYTDAQAQAQFEQQIGENFIDAQNTEFLKYIKILASKRIINVQKNFAVGQPITRAEAIKIIINALLVVDKTRFEVYAINANVEAKGCNLDTFTDVQEPSDWYYDFVMKALTSELISCQATSFRPNVFISRQEFAKIAYNALRIVAPEKLKSQSTVPFTDASDFGTDMLQYADALRANNIVNGKTDGKFLPNFNITRAEAAKIVANTFFPMESALAISFYNPNLPPGYLAAENRIHISTVSNSVDDLVNAMTAGGLKQNFSQYKAFSPWVAASAALMSEIAYLDSVAIRPLLSKIGFETDFVYGEPMFVSPTIAQRFADDGFNFFIAHRTIANHTQYIVAFRGTASRQNLATDLNGVNFGLRSTDPYCLSTENLKGKLHPGFCNLAKTVWSWIKDSPIESIKPILQRIAESDGTDASLTIVGHSLGGAAANILHALLVEHATRNGNSERAIQKIQTYTTGAPSSGDSTFVKAYSNQRIFRVRRELDPVATMGSLGSIHIGQEHKFAHLFTQTCSLVYESSAPIGPGTTVDTSVPINTGGCTPKIFQADYGYYGFNDSFPSPEAMPILNSITQLSLSDHRNIIYSDLLREFIGTAVGAYLQVTATPMPYSQ